MSVLEGPGSGVHDEFDAMIASFSASSDAAEQENIRLGIWDKFGTVGATFISDMASFSSTSREYGVCHFLKMIHRTRRTVAPIIADNGGQLLKQDFYGDPVNTASKLGEDLAGRSETLVTDRALAETDYVAPSTAEHMVARISDIEISYIKLSMTESGGK